MTHALSTTRLTSWVGVCALGLVMWIAVSAGALAQSPPSAEARLKELSITLPSVPQTMSTRYGSAICCSSQETLRLPHSQMRGEIGCARSARHPGLYYGYRWTVAGIDPHDTDCLRECRRPGRRRLRRKPSAARRQRHWFCVVRI
jgi:hypothetical protein